MSQENVELTHRAADAFNRRDLDAFLELMDPEIEFTTRFASPEDDPQYRGHDGIREWWADLLTVFPDLTYKIVEVRDSGDHGITAMRVRGHGLDSGAPLDEMLWFAWEAHDGKLARWRSFSSEDAALEAAGHQE